MLIRFSNKINYGDLFINSEGDYYLVIRNIFSDIYPVSVIDLNENRVDDEFTELFDIFEAYDVIQVIPSDKLILTTEEGE
jgi:hypothetical protein